MAKTSELQQINEIYIIYLQVLKLFTDMNDPEAIESWRTTELQTEELDDYAII